MKKMNKTEFDNLIKRNLEERYGKDKFGYNIDSECYENYYNKEEFQIFMNEMEDTEEYNNHYVKYNKGAGSELKEKKGRYGYVPPKMASVASSSRFCYLALRDGVNKDVISGNKDAISGNKIEFEYECKIRDMHAATYPQLDAYIKDSNTFIEAKCHEIFDHHEIEMSKKYEKYLSQEFGIDLEGLIENDKIRIPLSIFEIDEKSSRFDIKQLLCHLIGISCKKEELGIDNPKLVYMFLSQRLLMRS